MEGCSRQQGLQGLPGPLAAGCLHFCLPLLGGRLGSAGWPLILLGGAIVKAQPLVEGRSFCNFTLYSFVRFRPQFCRADPAIVSA